MPIGLAGPLLVDGEHAQGEFYVPMATAEGTLVASYNRGMKLLREAGGVKTTILDDRMQRAPAFLFESAREARTFGAGSTSTSTRSARPPSRPRSPGSCMDIEQYSASRILYTRFNYTTGDAAGQNLTGKATQAACQWILEHYPADRALLPRGQLRDRQEGSQVNMLRTRGKRVVAEATIPDALFKEVMRSSTALMFRARQVSNLGGFMSGVNNNGAHSANGITAMFIATGQDVANVAESSAAFVYAELRENGDYYYSVTIPSLIVATYGGGTGLATQRECLELLGCYGEGGVRKFTEIVAATVLCGELSLGSAIVAEEWVDRSSSGGSSGTSLTSRWGLSSSRPQGDRRAAGRRRRGRRARPQSRRSTPRRCPPATPAAAGPIERRDQISTGSPAQVGERDRPLRRRAKRWSRGTASPRGRGAQRQHMAPRPGLGEAREHESPAVPSRAAARAAAAAATRRGRAAHRAARRPARRGSAPPRPPGLGCMGMSGMYGPADAEASPPSTPRSMPASPCSTPATSTAWATTSC